MSERLDEYIWSLLGAILNSKEGVECDLCVNYLRSTCQKHLFAEVRLESLKQDIGEYFQAMKDDQIPSSLNIEMDFDHCILSLRSSIEHLAQLINSIVPLKMSPRALRGQPHVTLGSVVSMIEKNDSLRSNKHLSSLSEMLGSAVDEDWYKNLHDLRIQNYHVALGRLPKTTLRRTLNRELIHMTFLLPSDTCKNLKTENDRSIVSFCQASVQEVEEFLQRSFDLLSSYMSSSQP